MVVNIMAQPTETETPETPATDESIAQGAGVVDVASRIANLSAGTGMYSSIKGDDFETRKLIAKAVTTSTPVDDHKNQTINLKHVLIQPVEMENQQTGVISTQPRITLIDSDGTAYTATSVGLLTAITNLISVMGEPDTWPDAIPVQVVEQKGRNGYKFFTLALV